MTGPLAELLVSYL